MNKLDVSQINYNDEKTWQILSSGATKNVFQCESRLLQHWLKKIKPVNIWELAIVISLVRPGALENSMADDYVAYRNNTKEFESIHPVVDKILNTTGHVLCIEENTNVALANGGYKKIKDVVKGDKVQSYCTKTKKMVIETCMGNAQTKEGVGYKVRLKNGREIILTDNHKVLTYEGKKDVKDLNIEQDCIACPNAYVKNNNKNLIPDNIFDKTGIHIAYLVGLMIADGDLCSCMTNICVGTFETTADELISWINNNLKNIKTRKFFQTRCWYVSVSTDQKVENYKELGCGNRKNHWNLFLDNLNLRYKDCYDKFIPQEILNSSLEIQKSFMAGFFDGDGCLTLDSRNNTILHLTSMAPELIYGLSHMLTNFNILHTVRFNRIHIYSQKEFLDIVKKYCLFKNKRKTGHLATGITFGVVPYYELVNFKKNSGKTLEVLKKELHAQLFSKKKKFVSHRMYSKFLNCSSDMRYYEIESIEKIDNCVFYDMSVSNTHLLVGNGIIVSNCYQESLMQVGAKLAWPHLPEKEKSLKVDELRKAVGKKNQEKILKIGKEFVEGCLVNKVDQSVADRLFEIIKSCGRYLFNLSHAFAYAVKAYETAYLKANYPLQSLAVYLSYAQFKQAHRKEGKTFGGKWNEIEEIVNEGRKYLGVELLAPNINSKNENFAIENGSIRYGLGHIKYFGNSIEKVKKLPRIDKWQQVILLLCTDRFGFKLKATTGEALIKTGCFADTKVSRSDLLTAYTLAASLTEREMEKLADLLEANVDQPLSYLKNLLVEVVEIATKRRKETLEDEIKLLKPNQFDNPQWVEQVEKHYMGLPIQVTALDNISEQAGYGCQDLHDSLPLYTTRQIHIILDDVKTTVTKTGKNPGQEMCFVTGHDATGKVDRLPIFPELYATLKDDLFPPQMFCLTVHKGKGGWFVKEGYKLDTTRDSGKMQLSD